MRLARRAIHKSVKIARLRPAAEQKRTEPKKVEAPSAPGSGVSKMTVPTQQRIINQAMRAPINAPKTTAMRFLTALNQNARKSEIGTARSQPNESPIKIPLPGSKL